MTALLGSCHLRFTQVNQKCGLGKGSLYKNLKKKLLKSNSEYEVREPCGTEPLSSGNNDCGPPEKPTASFLSSQALRT